MKQNLILINYLNSFKLVPHFLNNLLKYELTIYVLLSKERQKINDRPITQPKIIKYFTKFMKLNSNTFPFVKKAIIKTKIGKCMAYIENDIFAIKVAIFLRYIEEISFEFTIINSNKPKEIPKIKSAIKPQVL